MSEYYKNRLSDLSVNIKDLTHCPNKDINPEEVEIVSKYIINEYMGLKLYDLYGEKQVIYVAGLSTRYALHNLKNIKKNVIEVAKTFGLWLSLVWVTDGIFDGVKNKDKEVYREMIISMIEDGKYTPRFNHQENNEDELIIAYQHIYRLYLTRVSNYNKHSVRMIEIWLVRYIKSLDYNDVNNLLGFRKWRLDSGAIMCVIWHNIMFRDTGFSINRIDETFFEDVSLVVSYHNDVLSYSRDTKDGTPNVITLIKNNVTNVSELSVIKYGIHLTDGYYKKLVVYSDLLREEILETGLTVLEGSYNWTNKEKRYASGLKMLKKLLRGSIHVRKGSGLPTAGDPVINH